ncbi:MAG: D-alanyl-D-alanine carboxypeptidase/D-alanyl-D-alanine-endopeptidase [Rhodobacteraceae bacterium]|nr:D-alanyl-D-alanine carboxypeptidase/D-alanyl-D-alanine-endopeptidase [Paracoccaceae bacterium]
MFLTRRALIAGMMTSAALPAFAGAPLKSLRPVPRPAGVSAKSIKQRHEQPALDRILREAKLSGKMSVVVADATSGKVLESHGAKTSLPPASVAKAITSLYTLDSLGGEHRFATRIIGTGPVVNGVLKGDILLVGGGDPHLDSDGLGTLAAQLKARGIKRITGKFGVYDRALPYQRVIDPGQPDHVGYNPAISGLNLNFNRVYFEWKRSTEGYSVTMDARGELYRPLVRSIKMTVVNRKSPLFTYKQGKNSENWTVAQTALGKGGGRWLPVRDTGHYAGEVFRALAARHGLTLPRGSEITTTPSGTVLAQGDGGRVWAVLRAMLKYSTNLTAEVSGLSATQARGAKASTLVGSARVMTAWAQGAYGIKGAKFVDHSGLGDKTRISAGQMTDVLVKTGWNGALRPLLKDIRLVNSKGKRAPIKGVSVVAKTGTLNFASALSGYIDCPNGRKLAFTIFTADLARRDKISKAQRERPEGGRSWSRRAKRMQQKLLRRWALEYGVA